MCACRAAEGLQGAIKPIIIDVTNDASIEAAAAQVTKDGELVVALVNNAGVADLIAPIEIAPKSSWKFQFDVNVFGVVETTRVFLPMLRKTKGRIVNLGSIAGDIAKPGKH